MNDDRKNDSMSIMNNHISKKTKKKGPYLLGQTLGEGAFAKVKRKLNFISSKIIKI